MSNLARYKVQKLGAQRATYDGPGQDNTPEPSPAVPETSRAERVLLPPEKLTALAVRDESALFSLPDKDSEEEAQLRASLKEHGQRDDITVVDGMLIDGRRRVRAALALGISLWAVVRDDMKEKLLEFVLDIQFRRRETTVAERAFVMASPSVRAHYQRAAKARQGQRNFQPTSGEGRGQWEDVAGAVAKVSGTAIREAVTVTERGLPVLRELVIKNKVGLGRAARFAAKHSLDEQSALLARGPDEFLATLRESSAKSSRPSATSGAGRPVPALAPDTASAASEDHSTDGIAASDVRADAAKKAGTSASSKTGPSKTGRKPPSNTDPLSANQQSLPGIPGPERPGVAVQREVQEALSGLFGREPRMAPPESGDVPAACDVLLATARTKAHALHSLLAAEHDEELVVVAPTDAGSEVGQALLAVAPTCIVASGSDPQPLLVAYRGQRVGRFAAAFTHLGAVVVPVPPSPPMDDIIKIVGPGGIRIRAHRADGDLWVAAKDVAAAIGTSANVIDKDLKHLLLKNGRDPDLKVVPARSLGERLRHRTALVQKLQGADREAWCAFLERAGGGA